MMQSYTPEYLKKMLEDHMKKNKIQFNEITVKVQPKKYHHQDMDVFVIFPPKEGVQYGRSGAIFFKGAPTGCGLVIMHRHYMTASIPGMIPVISRIIQHYKEDGAGTIMATQGGHEYDKCEILLQLGFSCVTSYDNLAHGSSKDRQSIYVRSEAREEEKKVVKIVKAVNRPEDNDD